MSRQRRQARRMMCPNKPRGHVCAATSQMGYAGVDMIPTELRVPTSAKRVLYVGIEFAEVVKRGGVNDCLRQLFPFQSIAVIGDHRVGARSGPPHHIGNVFRVRLRFAAC